MEHFTVKATAVETSEQTGSFVALVSTFEVDRQGDKIMPGAFRASLDRWRKSGAMIPVEASHDDAIDAVIGHIDPRLTHETPEGLEATGVIDRSTELGARVYKLLKARTLSWSIGFMIPPGGRRKNGDITEITEIDWAECSVVSVPANAGVRTLSIKSAESATRPLDETEQEILRTLRREWEQKKAAEKAAAVPAPPTSRPARAVPHRIWLGSDGVMHDEVITNEDSQSPGWETWGRPLPSKNALRAAEREEKRLALEAEEKAAEKAAAIEASRRRDVAETPFSIPAAYRRTP